MAGLSLKLAQLQLDLENPRISRAGNQLDALQKIIEDQDVKLVVLAESIVDERLNPMDRWLVMKSPTEAGKYTVLEGNRRLAAIKILNNPGIMDGLEVRSQVKKGFQELIDRFKLDDIQPVDCYEVKERAVATAWINQRHTGENKGRGIVDWNGVAKARFRGRDPALQALDLVLNHGNLSDDEKAQVEDRFPITTLDRVLSNMETRAKLGIEISDSKLKTDLPATEIIKPLRRIVLDLAAGEKTVSDLKLKGQINDYVTALGRDLPNLGKRGARTKPVDELGSGDFSPSPPKPKPKPKPKPQAIPKTLIPRDANLTVSNPKIAEIVRELRSLKLEDSPHAVSVLFRVFLEQSVDHYLTAAGISLHVTSPVGKKDKSLRKKVGEAIAEMVKQGAPQKHLAGVEKGIDDKQNPLYVEALHNYVHNRFYSPTERELRVAWNNSAVFFENIWK